MNNVILGVALAVPALAVPKVVFQAETIDDKITVGYGLAVADVDGDGKQDILLADSARTVAYQAPDWKIRELTGKLTPRDHVCLCAKDLNRRQGGDLGGSGLESRRHPEERGGLLTRPLGGLLCQTKRSCPAS